MAPDARRDTHFMTLALGLAARADGATSPNPMVGAVVVRQGRIVGRGYHRRAGLPHAEVEALRQAGARARGATLYVTLEPCAHHGRTPPCTEAILASGLRRVVVGTRDPNPITNGRGVRRLRRRGVQVALGVLEPQARRLTEAFRKRMLERLPLGIVKIAQSLDGKIATATGRSRWITGASSRRHTHRLRGQVDAILVGIETVRRDDPLLTVRTGRRRRDRPIKVIVDSRLRMPLRARCLSTHSPAPTLIATVRRSAARQRALERAGAEVLRLPPRGGRVPLRRLFRELARRGVASVLVEGGGEVVAGVLAERLADRVVWYVAPRLVGGRTTRSAVGGPGIRSLSQAVRLAEVTVRRLGPDLCVEGRVVYPRATGRAH